MCLLISFPRFFFLTGKLDDVVLGYDSIQEYQVRFLSPCGLVLFLISVCEVGFFSGPVSGSVWIVIASTFQFLRGQNPWGIEISNELVMIKYVWQEGV